MVKKRALLGGATIKVENMSGFDKSAFNAITAPLGAIVPLRKQLLIPGSFDCRVKISAQLPPLASDAFLRTHLKVEAFVVPMRLCYGGFQSWFSGEQISDGSGNLVRAQLPCLDVGRFSESDGLNQDAMNAVFGVHSLMDYFDVKWPLTSTGNVNTGLWPADTADEKKSQLFNIFPFIAYQLCYHHWYRNKLVQRPLFAVPAINATTDGLVDDLPYISHAEKHKFKVYVGQQNAGQSSYGDYLNAFDFVRLLNGHLLEVRQRNYGYDYFTTALPSAQDGQPMVVDTSGGSFTISALRLQNSLQHFAEVNQLAGPDYLQVCRARYGIAPSDSVAQKPILCGSADFPMYTSGVEQTAQDNNAPTSNPFNSVGARYGRAHAEGTDFVCKVDVKEPSYLLVLCSLVPEANYANGIAHDMRLFTKNGDLVDLPCAELENTGYEPVYTEELGIPGRVGPYTIFGYQPRYMFHKAGQVNGVHGLFRYNASLASFIPQRNLGFERDITIGNDFLEVKPTDLDNVTAVSGDVSRYGVMIDSSVELFVSEPLGESALPSLVDPAAEHGHSVYVKRGGTSVE